MKIRGHIVDLHRRRIFPGELSIEGGRIVAVEEVSGVGKGEGYLLPGFVDAHVHVESSMLVPSEFARMAVPHGTVATVSDPHEIANVLGEDGVHFMLENGRQVPFKFAFGAPSCVPATAFETAGAALGAEAVERLLRKPEIHYLSEMMNYPGVLHEDPEVLRKIHVAQALGKPVDGHAPGLRGEDARRYFAAGITTDHECFTYEEGREKAQLGVRILIREGSAARNFDALIPLLGEFPAQIMFCSDDKHPDDLLEGHIDRLAARAVAAGYDLFDTLRAACLHPVEHYRLPVGLLRPGDPADFIRCEDLVHFRVLETWLDGRCAAREGRPLFDSVPCESPNRFDIRPKSPEDFRLPARSETLRVIRALDGQLVTEAFTAPARIVNGFAVSDPERDLLLCCVVNRYAEAPPALAFIQGFGLKQGAIASCVAHDSHNIVAVGSSAELLCRAVNLVIENRGGISAVSPDEALALPLPVAGIMSPADGRTVAEGYARLDRFARTRLQSPLRAPFMTLSFMALLVIPRLKLSDRGLFDGERFGFVEVFV